MPEQERCWQRTGPWWGARCQRVGIRGDETLCAAEAGILIEVCGCPSSQAGGQRRSPWQREGSAQFQRDLWEAVKWGEDRASLAGGSSPCAIWCSLVSSDHAILLVCLAASIPSWQTALCHHVLWHVHPCIQLQGVLYTAMEFKGQTKVQ